MRRGMRHAHTLGSKKPIFFKLFDVLLNEMSKSYPELNTGKDLIIETLKNEDRGVVLTPLCCSRINQSTGLDCKKMFNIYT